MPISVLWRKAKGSPEHNGRLWPRPVPFVGQPVTGARRKMRSIGATQKVGRQMRGADNAQAEDSSCPLLKGTNYIKGGAVHSHTESGHQEMVYDKSSRPFHGACKLPLPS